MAWLSLDDCFAENEKIQDLSDRAFRLHVTALCYCARNLTDGRLSGRAVKVCAVLAGNSRPSRNVQELVDAGLWHEEDEGYAINDYLAYNPSREDVKAKREANAARQKKYRDTHRDEDGRFTSSNAVRNEVSNALRNTAPSQPLPAKPKEDQGPAVLEDDYGRTGAIKRLLSCLKDADDGTKAVVRGVVERNSLSVGDIEWARECAAGPGVRSPTRVAVAELQKRAGLRGEAPLSPEDAEERSAA